MKDDQLNENQHTFNPKLTDLTISHFKYETIIETLKNNVNNTDYN
jgi:hypothetical protein